MDTNDPTQIPDLLSSDFIKVDDRSGENWRSAASWARTIAIIGIAISIMAFIFFGFFGFGLSQALLLFAYSYLLVIIIVAVVVGVMFVILFPLLRFGNNVKNAVEISDATLFEKGITALKVFFIIIGILTGIQVFASLITIINTL